MLWVLLVLLTPAFALRFPGYGGEDAAIADAPTLLWSNGGPGASSIGYGLMAEGIGPLRMNMNTGAPEKSAWSWTSFANVIFIDYPYGVGFSRNHPGGVTAYTLEEVARQVADGLQQIFANVASLRTSPLLFVAAESFGGKYGPHVCRELLSRAFQPPLGGLALGSGVTDVPLLMRSVPEYFSSHGLVQRSVAQKSAAQVELLGSAAARGDYVGALVEFGLSMGILLGASGPVNVFDSRRFGKYNFTAASGYYSRADVKAALGVPANTTYMMDNSFVEADLLHWLCKSDGPIVEMLLQKGVPVLIYNGVYDPTVTITGSLNFTSGLQWSGQRHYRDTPRSFWTLGGRMAGYRIVPSGGILQHATLTDSGHMAPMDDGAAMHYLMREFVTSNQ